MSSLEPLIKIRRIQKSSVRFYLSTEFSKKYTRKTLSLSYPEDIDLEVLPPSVVDIPLITNVIAVIWFSGKKYAIEEMDEDLYYSLRKIKAFYQRFFYNTTWEGELVPERLVKNRLPYSTIQSASMFTGGLDSTTTVLRHLDENPTLISLNEPHEQAVEFAKAHNLNVSKISTNYYDFLKLSYLNTASIDITKWFWDTSMGMSWVGVAAPFLYAKGIPVLYIPSGFTWHSFLFPDGQTMRQPASPVIDENMSPMGLRVQHDVFTMTRTDKMQFISQVCAEKNLLKPQLVVCTHHSRSNTSYSHCNKCFKCLITMLDIMAIGDRLRDYGFTLSEEEFISQFQSYVESLAMRRGGTYTAFHDTQRYIQKNISQLPQNYRPFYEWFVAIDFWERVEKSSNRPLRDRPFSWSDYEDLYSGVKNFVD